MNLSASMTSVDPLHMEAALAAVAPHVASWHVDVMDGSFAPAFGFGPAMVSALVARDDLPVDVHLMIERPDRWAARFAAMGVRSVAFHFETDADVPAIANAIRCEGAAAYLGLRPETPVETAMPLFDHVDGCLILTAPPGGGSFDGRALRKPLALPEHLLTIVDGRIDERHFETLHAANVTHVVIGQALFGSANQAEQAANLVRAMATHSTRKPKRE